MKQRGLRYDGSIDKYPITEGEIYCLGNGSKITIADITLGLPEFSKDADCIFIDPAGSKGVLKAYYTKADKACPVDNFDEFVAYIKRCIEQVNPDRLFVESFYRNKNQLLPMVESLFSVREGLREHLLPQARLQVLDYPRLQARGRLGGCREWTNGMRCSRFARMFRSSLQRISSWDRDLLRRRRLTPASPSMEAT